MHWTRVCNALHRYHVQTVASFKCVSIQNSTRCQFWCIQDDMIWSCLTLLQEWHKHPFILYIVAFPNVVPWQEGNLKEFTEQNIDTHLKLVLPILPLTYQILHIVNHLPSSPTLDLREKIDLQDKHAPPLVGAEKVPWEKICSIPAWYKYTNQK